MISPEATRDLSAALTLLLADMVALYLKTKNFHWHLSGQHFHAYRLMLDEQAGQILTTANLIAERTRKIGGTTLRSVSHVGRLQRILDNDAYTLVQMDMLAELCDDNRDLTRNLRQLHALCGDHGDVATASLLETWIDEAEGRTWYLVETANSQVSTKERLR
jgi:starvation-inducible DNA-binding protein